MKTCSKCGVSQPFELFPKLKHKPHLHSSQCRVCVRERARKWRTENLDRARESSRDRHAKDRDAANAGRSLRHNIAMQNDPAYRDRHNASATIWRLRNPDRAKQKSTEWTKNNPDKNSARVARRRATTLCATPAWANQEEIESIFRRAKELNLLTGVKHHVDHIVPLKGKTVCGLHVHWNLRVIPAIENISKGAKLIEELALA